MNLKSNFQHSKAHKPTNSTVTSGYLTGQKFLVILYPVTNQFPCELSQEARIILPRLCHDKCPHTMLNTRFVRAVVTSSLIPNHNYFSKHFNTTSYNKIHTIWHRINKIPAMAQDNWHASFLTCMPCQWGNNSSFP